jgi:hypothetical protein
MHNVPGTAVIGDEEIVFLFFLSCFSDFLFGSFNDVQDFFFLSRLFLHSL